MQIEQADLILDADICTILGASDVEEARKIILSDYKYAYTGRILSDMAYSEMKRGHAAFAVGADGKEVPQAVAGRMMRKGDYHSGYYRDLVIALVTETCTTSQFFTHHYNITDSKKEPQSGGRQMIGHYSTRMLDDNGEWKDQTEILNFISNVSPTAGHIPRVLGLAKATDFYSKHLSDLGEGSEKFAAGGEIVFATIGDASTSEGMFFETMNAICAYQLPVLLSVWDDSYGISVPSAEHNAQGSISKSLLGFAQKNDNATKGMKIFTAKGWNYWELCTVYTKAEAWVRNERKPAMVHVEELTQPHGHSSSGNHARYKSKQRLDWEQEYDNIQKMKEWVLSTTISVEGKEEPIATQEQLDEIEESIKKDVKQTQKKVYKSTQAVLKTHKNTLLSYASSMELPADNAQAIKDMIATFKSMTQIHIAPYQIFATSRQLIHSTATTHSLQRQALIEWSQSLFEQQKKGIGSHLYSQAHTADKVPHIPPTYDISQKEKIAGRKVLNENFKRLMEKYPEIVIFGEDVEMGDVHLGMENLYEMYGKSRIFDTGICETAIIGMGVGLSMRGLRPIADIQYLDYIFYAIPTLTDDLATTHYRSAGGQKSPLIVRTRGHRLQGVWHSGSQMGALINCLKGMYILTPRNFTQASGFYNALLQTDNPALLIEPLNGYEIKEEMPLNIGEYTTPIGEVEVLKEGKDITVVSYGSTLNLVLMLYPRLVEVGIECEIIDVQTLIPFDTNHRIVESLQKTNRLVVVDEDVPGGASAFILQQILQTQGGYMHLDSAPVTITGRNHRPAGSRTGDYFSKPSQDDIFEQIYHVMHEAQPYKYPQLPRFL